MRYEDDREAEDKVITSTAAARAYRQEVAESGQREESGHQSVAVLSDEHRIVVLDLLHESMTEPVYSVAHTVSILEGLIGAQPLTPAVVYRIIDDHYEVLRQKIAERAFSLGLQMGLSHKGASES